MTLISFFESHSDWPPNGPSGKIFLFPETVKMVKR